MGLWVSGLFSKMFFLTAGLTSGSDLTLSVFPFLRDLRALEAGLLGTWGITSAPSLGSWVLDVSWWVSLGRGVHMGWLEWASLFSLLKRLCKLPRSSWKAAVVTKLTCLLLLLPPKEARVIFIKNAMRWKIIHFPSSYTPVTANCS